MNSPDDKNIVMNVKMLYQTFKVKCVNRSCTLCKLYKKKTDNGWSCWYRVVKTRYKLTTARGAKPITPEKFRQCLLDIFEERCSTGRGWCVMGKCFKDECLVLHLKRGD